MKKLIGIILAVCMLSTMAFAATVTTSDVTNSLDTMTVTFTYAGLADGAQATLLAYDVTGVEGATAATAYVDQETTPIVGIDQEATDGSFSFKVADTFRGSIVVKVGGTDVATPASFLVTFAEPVDDGVTILFGDINGDGFVTSADGVAVINATYTGGTTVFGDYTIGEAIVAGGTTLFGDINGDGFVTSADGVAVINATYTGGTTVFGEFTIGQDATITK